MLSGFPRITKRLKLLPPAHIKPGPFWTGKQVRLCLSQQIQRLTRALTLKIISTVILNCLPDGCFPLNLDSKAKTAESNWKVAHAPMKIISELSESKVQPALALMRMADGEWLRL